jgi:hypothetical protein
MKKAISKISNIFNKVSLYTLYFLIFLLYVILFEIPIPFLASKVVKTIYEENKQSFDENNVELSIKSIALGWSYNVNRPVVIIKGISYTQRNYSVNLTKIGFYPSIKNSIKEKELFLEKIFFEGLNLIVTADEKYGYKIQLDNQLLINNKETEQQKIKEEKSTKQQESFLDRVQKKENFKNANFYQLVLDIKKEIPALKFLNEFIIYKSNIIFINQQKRLLILDVDNLSLNEQPKDIYINLKSSLTFDNDTNKISKLMFNGSINSKNIVKWDLSLEKMLLANFHNYVIKDNYLEDLFLEGFEGNINFNGFYNTVSGLQDFNSKVDVKQGVLSYKNYISKPMKINNLSYNLFFDKKANVLNVKGFNVSFANNNILDSDKLGLKILLNKLKADLKFDFKDNSLVVDKLSLFSGINQADLFIDYLPYSPSNQGYLKLDAITDNLDVGFIQQAWPKSYLADIRKWIATNISEGKVDKTSFRINLILLKNSTKINLLEGDVFLSDVKLTYLKGLPFADAKKVNVQYNQQGASIKYEDAITGNITSKKGEVRFYNNSKNIEHYESAILLDLDVTSSVLDALLFINNKPLDLLKQASLDTSKLSGDVEGTVKLVYLFEKHDVVNKNIELQLSNVSFKEVLPKIDLTNANLKLLINDSGLKINGEASVFDEKIETNVQVNWENSNNTIQTYSVDVANFPVQKIYQTDFIDTKILDMVVGSIDGNFVYYKDSNIEKLSFYNDLTNALFYIDVFNYKNKVGEKITIEGNSIFKNGEMQEIKNLKLSASDISASINIKINKDGGKTLIFNNFYIKNKANFKGTIDFSDNMKSFKLQGPFIDLAPIFSYFKGKNTIDTVEEETSFVNKEVAKKKRGITLRKEEKEIKQEDTKKEIPLTDIPEDNFDNINTDDFSLSEKIGNINLKLNFDKIVNGDASINNVSLNLLWQNNFLEVLSFSTNMDNSRENSYAIFDERTSILGLRIRNIGNLLRVLDFSGRIKDGDLEGKVNITKIVSNVYENKFYIETNGEFVLNNFSAGLSFATAYGKFRGKDLYFRVDQLELQGNLMGGSMKGYIDIKDRELDLYGKLIPIWSASNLLVNAPILKTLFNNVPVAKNLIQINARIKGSFDDIKYSVFSRNLQKGDIINELNYSKLSDEFNDLKTQENKTNEENLNNLDTNSSNTTKDANEENLNNPDTNSSDTTKDANEENLNNPDTNSSDTTKDANEENLNNPDTNSSDTTKDEVKEAN